MPILKVGARLHQFIQTELIMSRVAIVIAVFGFLYVLSNGVMTHWVVTGDNPVSDMLRGALQPAMEVLLRGTIVMGALAVLLDVGRSPRRQFSSRA